MAGRTAEMGRIGVGEEVVPRGTMDGLTPTKEGGAGGLVGVAALVSLGVLSWCCAAAAGCTAWSLVEEDLALC